MKLLEKIKRQKKKIFTSTGENVKVDKNLIISILSSEKEMKYVTEILRDII